VCDGAPLSYDHDVGRRAVASRDICVVSRAMPPSTRSTDHIPTAQAPRGRARSWARRARSPGSGEIQARRARSSRPPHATRSTSSPDGLAASEEVEPLEQALGTGSCLSCGPRWYRRPSISRFSMPVRVFVDGRVLPLTPSVRRGPVGVGQHSTPLTQHRPLSGRRSVGEDAHAGVLPGAVWGLAGPRNGSLRVPPGRVHRARGLAIVLPGPPSTIASATFPP
jgi:hypothetical protein